MIIGTIVISIIAICLVFTIGRIHETYLYVVIFDVVGIGLWLVISNFVVNSYLKNHNLPEQSFF